MLSCSFMKSWAAKLVFVLSAVPLAGCGRSFPCEDPGPVQIANKDTGFAFCMNGPVHRPKIQACPTKIPRAGECKAPEGAFNGCSTDADCSDKPNSFCRADFLSPGNAFKPGCSCAQGCTTDAECGEGKICLCGDPVGTCVEASCTSDADCGGLQCAKYTIGPGCNFTGFACQDPADECMTDLDCAEGTQCTITDDHRFCSEPICNF
jgi:hypothetical protein